MKRELNDRFLRSLKPEEGRLEISDTKCIGLRFRLSPHGHASWVYEKRVKGGPKRKHTLGTWPEPCSLSKARKLALELQAEASQGIDRVELAKVEKRRKAAESASLMTVQQAIVAYTDLHLNTIRTGAERQRQLLQSLSEHLEKSITDLTRKDLQAAIDKKAQSGRKTYANRIRAALVAFANWCFVRSYVTDPIGAGIARATKEKARDRVPTLNEVRKIWAATWEMGDVWGPFFRLLILTGQRRGEISNLRWSEIDFDARVIVKPGVRTKNGKPHTTHLAEPACRQLFNLAETTNGSDFVFSFDGIRPVANPSDPKRRLDVLVSEGVAPWRIHDIRTAMATALAEAGEPEAVVDRILNHSASGSASSAVARVYNQAQQLPQRARALDRWADMVTEARGMVVTMIRK